ncbi:hypothetical protein [Exiguobacterium sp. R-17]|uniref:hypothetical protein n=1 Tax=Exiguobacterium sp. R-17 TaxID=3404054 RepID=UPI003CF9562A
MKTYKAIHLLNEKAVNELKNISSLFSEKERLIFVESKPYVCVSFTPDVYFKNIHENNSYFISNYFKPLIMTNYKFLSLLLEISEDPNYKFIDFSFKQDGDEGDQEKEFVEEIISRERNVQASFDFLESKDQTIKYIDLIVCDSKHPIRIDSSGNISVPNNFSEKYSPYIINLIEYLFTGHINKL